MARILTIEDEADLREIVAYNLRQAGHEVLEAADAATGLRLARERAPDLVLLDLMLPDRPGTEVCALLKRDPATARLPVVMLTARGEERDRVVGFELGADDYVTKPFSVRELALRVGAVLRRVGQDQAPALRWGRLRLEREAHRAFVCDREIELTALEFRLLSTLLERRDRVQTREQLLDDVWGTASEVTLRTVDASVKRLREKLGEAGAYVETVRGVGYRLAAVPPGEPA